MAQDACTQLGLERLLFVPARLPPHKEAAAAPPELRLEMVEAAVADDERMAVDDLELRRAGPSYTVDTLRQLARRYADAELFLLIGADQFREFATWHEAAQVARLARLAVLDRLDLGLDESAAALERAGIAVDAARVDATRIDISSTIIRERVRTGLPVRYLVPPAVEEIMRREGSYES